MRASDFAPPTERQFGPGVRFASALLLYGILWPLSKLMLLLRRWPPFPSIESYAEAARDYRPTAADIFVCSYFKSGTTWLLQVVTQIAFKGEAEFANIHHAVPWTETPKQLRDQMIPIDDPSPARLSPTGKRAIKSHFAFPLVPQSPQARYIAMVRDPKAVAVSGYHFMKAMSLGPMMPPFRFWIDLFLSPTFFEGTWAAHLASYWARRDDANMLFLTYEELRVDLPGGVDRIAHFLGIALSEAERAAVIERSSFAAMKRDAEKFDPGRVMPWTRDGAMVREGGGGTPDGMMTPQLARRIDDHCRAELRALGCDFDYDAAFPQ